MGEVHGYFHLQIPIESQCYSGNRRAQLAVFTTREALDISVSSQAASTAEGSNFGSILLWMSGWTEHIVIQLLSLLALAIEFMGAIGSSLKGFYHACLTESVLYHDMECSLDSCSIPIIDWVQYLPDYRKSIIHAYFRLWCESAWKIIRRDPLDQLRNERIESEFLFRLCLDFPNHPKSL